MPELHASVRAQGGHAAAEPWPPPQIPVAAENLAHAWQTRGQRATADLDAARRAPALFKPEWTERARAELQTAQRNLTYWLGIGHG